jgi:hypothetical protein
VRERSAMTAGIGLPSSDDEWRDAAVDYFSTAFPNPTREGCPDRERLRQSAMSADVVTGDIRTHLFQCSECFTEFRSARMAGVSVSQRAGAGAPASSRRLRAIAAIAAVTILFVGISVLLRDGVDYRIGSRSGRASGRGGDSSPASSVAGPRESTSVVRIQVQVSSMRRGTPQSPESATASIAIQPGPMRFEIALPDGYPEGVYGLAIVNPFDEVFVETRGVSVEHSFAAFVDASRVPAGRGFLRIDHAGQPPDYVPIVVGRRDP